MNQLKIFQCVTARTMTVDDYLRDVNRLPMVSPEEEAQLDLTRERVRQLKEKAIRKLARPEIKKNLVQYR